VGQPSAATAAEAPAINAVASRMPEIAERQLLASGACDIPGLLLAGIGRTSFGQDYWSEGLVRLDAEVGTEPEGWCVDLP